jgi:hypothetical protein
VTFHTKIRAPERRRFVPSTEGLETRELMAALNTLFGLQVATNLNVPITYQQKAKRIENLPYYMSQIVPGRFLPKTEIAEIQSALYGMIDSINKPPTEALNNFNYQLRKVVQKQSLNSTDIQILNHGVTAVLKSANAPTDSVSVLASALNTLTSQVDTASVQPVFLGTNDNTIVLQTALAIGRPMPPPQLPTIQKSDGVQAGAQHIKTPLARPTLVGTYHFHTVVQVVTPTGEVVGSFNCHKNNDYKVQITTPLSVGVHEFRLQAVDDAGHVSRLGAPFLIKVVPRKNQATPKGPLGTSK